MESPSLLPQPAESAARLFVLTDISAELPVAVQALIRLLLYSNEIEIEGIVATQSQWKALRGSQIRRDLIDRVVDAYADDWGNLQLHDSRFPAPKLLRGRVAAGNGNGMTAVGPGQQTEGSDLLVEALSRPDPRPIWVAVWGGAATLAQALLTLRERLANVADLEAVLHRLYVHEIQGRDDAGAWIAHTFPGIHYLRNQSQYRAFADADMASGKQPHATALLPDELCSALARLYPCAGLLQETDSPAWLNLVPNGLCDPRALDQGGWGGRFAAILQTAVWSGGCPVADESRFGNFRMYHEAADTWLHLLSGKQVVDSRNPLRRWTAAVECDFRARMGWTWQRFADAHHPPVAVVNGDRTRQPLQLTIRIGDSARIDASASYDPHGRRLSYRWWIYPECCAPGTLLEMEVPESPVLKFQIPAASATGTVHLILEVANHGPAELIAYRRVIVNIMP